MKIASITVYCNEYFRLESWYSYYTDYATTIYKHIIINNGEKSDTPVLKNKFPNSIVLFSESKALTSSYNLGIKHALEDSDVDSIMLIGNDIKIDIQNVVKLHNFLFSSQDLGMVAPVLFKKDSEIIEVFGAEINYKNLKYKHLHVGESLQYIKYNTYICDSVPGGMNLAKRSFYEVLGLQDENLFMYADEIDTGIKAKKKNIKISSTLDCVSWHQHVDKSKHKIRSPLAGFLKGRNSIYLAHKHFNFLILLKSFSVWFIEAIRINLSAWIKNKSIDHKKYCYYFLMGTIFGLFRIKRIPSKLF